jgi:hypothetical protein
VIDTIPGVKSNKDLDKGHLYIYMIIHVIFIPSQESAIKSSGASERDSLPLSASPAMRAEMYHTDL